MNRVSFFVVAFVILSLYMIPIAFAGDWRSDFTTKDGRMNCCGISDCRPLPRGYWIKEGDKFIVFEGQPPTEITVVHPSQDHQVWICSTGCGFMPGTS